MDVGNLRRGRKLVSMTLDSSRKEPLPPAVENKEESSQFLISSTPKKANQSDLIQLEDLGVDLFSNETFASIYKETQQLLLDDIFPEISDEQIHDNAVPAISESGNNFNISEDPSFIENSDEISYIDLNKPFKIRKYISGTPQDNTPYSLKPPILIAETPPSFDKSSTENFCVSSANNTTENIQEVPFTCRSSQENYTEYSAAENNLITNQNNTIEQSSLLITKTQLKDKHPMIVDHCGYKCRRNCKNFTIDERYDIWKSYWTLRHDDQLKWCSRLIKLKPVNVRTTNKQENLRKTESREFSLPYTNGHTEIVCKKFFLNTLGYKNDSLITTISKKLKQNPTGIVSDLRGTNEKAKIDTTVIKNFINSYNPCAAHHRRHNSPNRLYLSQDLGLSYLFEEFKKTNPEFQCSLELFRQTLKKMNISLRKPQNDKCFDCELYTINVHNALKEGKIPKLQTLCEEKVHKSKAAKAAAAYMEDALKNKSDTKIYSMDMQKTVLMPMMPEYKDCFFTSRLVCFNMTFCGLQKGSKEGSKCIVWHEATSGRDGKDIVDAIYKFILSERDTRKFIFWADNCSAQNKNWILFTSLVIIVNLLDIEFISIKYLTKGHTHMSADGVHGNIERNFKKTKQLYDFQDYIKCIELSRARNVVVEVMENDKYNWDRKKKANLKNILLTDLVEVKFVKNNRCLLYKKSFDEKDYTELDFIQKRFKTDKLPQKINKPRGIRSAKKDEILSKLVPLMPANRKSFWINLPQCPTAQDLIQDGQMLEE